ncbi:PH domain-containing protein [Psychroserpens sp. Hel_I_66]|uniref:PH domain-containing protein n=1 Tax=Psychroserpens sp. Hel_I_66 TaxID=1250004 RepID=UPI000646F3AC|nr:PH domain-containing protein [Psychroserpens sp. Hel_I_66]
MFENQQIEVDLLPKIDAVQLKPISEHYLKIIILNKLLLYTFLIGVVVAGKFMVQKESYQAIFPFALGFVLFFCIINFVLALLAFKKRKYAIREQDVIYAKGLLVNSITTVPISRIQHIEESRSWLARKFNLSTLKIFTAGESGSDLSIDGLPHEEAKKINDYLSEKVNEDN